MNNMKNVIDTALASVVATGLVIGAGTAMAATHKNGMSKNMEKCYCITKKGMNSCGGKKAGHTCQGQAKVDGSPYDWILVPKGTCDKILGASTEPGKCPDVKLNRGEGQSTSMNSDDSSNSDNGVSSDSNDQSSSSSDTDDTSSNGDNE